MVEHVMALCPAICIFKNCYGVLLIVTNILIYHQNGKMDIRYDDICSCLLCANSTNLNVFLNWATKWSMANKMFYCFFPYFF